MWQIMLELILIWKNMDISFEAPKNNTQVECNQLSTYSAVCTIVAHSLVKLFQEDFIEESPDVLCTIRIKVPTYLQGISLVDGYFELG